jgi:t-SNARE complex subunit (syntaxin)
MRDLDRVMLQSKREARHIKQTLDTLMAENEAYEKKHPGATSAQMRKNMLATHCRQFQDVMNDFQNSTQAFRQSLKERIARQARIVQEDITDDQIEVSFLHFCVLTCLRSHNVRFSRNLLRAIIPVPSSKAR